MDLGTLVIMVVLGVSAVLLVSHLTGGSEGAQLIDDSQVLDLWSLEDAAPIRDVIRGDDGTAALLETRDGRIAVISVLGDGFVCRTVGPDSRVDERDETLRIRLPDVGSAAITLAVADAPTRAAWLTRLEEVRS